METPYTKRAATYDQDAAKAYLRCVRGDTFEMLVDMVSEHPNPTTPGDIVSTPVDVAALSWDSSVMDNAGTQVGAFTITHEPNTTNRIRVQLAATDTAAMTHGTYQFWIDSINSTTQHRRTWLRGELEIIRKAGV